MRWLLLHAAPWLDALYAATTLAVVGIAASPGSLSAQVLRLLTRDNDWSGTQTFDNGTLELDSALAAPLDVTDRLYNIGGNLYFNGTLVATSAGAGTVTSVGLTLPAIFSVAGSPVVAAGTFVATLVTQLANRVWAGPTTGAAAVPTFRALVDADIPDDITIAGTGNVTWASVSKSGSSLSDLATVSASALNAGTVPDICFPATLPAASGANLTALNATQLTSGAVPTARMPAFTGDITTVAGGVTATLANSGVVAGSYGSATLVPVVTVDAKGRITLISTVSLVSSFVPSLIAGAVRGSVLVGNSTPQFAVNTPTVPGQMLRYDGSDTGWSVDASALTGLNASALASGTTPVVRGGLGTSSTPTDGQIPIGRTATNDYVLGTFTGTPNQVVVTVGPGTVTLSLPQSISTASAPQFARIGAGTGPDATAPLYVFGPLKRRLVANGNSGAAFALDLSAADEQSLTLTANCVITLNNPVAGAIYRLFLVQDGAGSHVPTWPTIKWTGGAAPTLTTTAGKTDIITLYYDGTSYFGTSSLNF